MPTPEEMRETMLLYIERVGQHDVDGVLRLFSEDISVEDPVGGPPGTHVVGREAVESFFRKGFAHSRPRPELTGSIRTTGGDEAAMPFILRLELRGEACEIDVIDVMRFAPDGTIKCLRAFWNASEIRADARQQARNEPDD